MKASADLIRKAGIEERDSEIEGKAARVAASESGSRTSFNRGKGISGQNEHNVSQWILFNSVISASSVVKTNFAA
jgi:hypothetical protein